jgi:hypothetical protein
MDHDQTWCILSPYVNLKAYLFSKSKAKVKGSICHSVTSLLLIYYRKTLLFVFKSAHNDVHEWQYLPLTFKTYMVQEFLRTKYVSNFVKAHCSFVGKGIMAINNTSSISISNGFKSDQILYIKML